MPAHRRPRCGFCLKELSNAKHIALHIANTPKCRKARDREVNHRSPSPSVEIFSNTNARDPDPTMADNADGFAWDDEANLDHVSSEQLGENDDMIPNQLQLAEVEDEDASGRYAEEYNPEDVAHILRESQTTFETIKEDQKYARLAKKPWAPFEDNDEWQLAQFLIKEVSQTAANKYLKLSIVSEQPRFLDKLT